MKEKLKANIPIHCAHSAIAETSSLKPYPKNNKKHPEAQLKLLCKAIIAQGWRGPITVSKQSGFIVRGHARLEAAKRLGLKTVPVDYQEYASESLERADRIADNKLSELAEWDLPALQDELAKLCSEKIDMDLTGFDENEFKKFIEQNETLDKNKNQSGALGERYEIIVACASELEQVALLERFSEEGLRCKAFIL
jgi:ParB-like chromosome segregation protein Spo0J